MDVSISGRNVEVPEEVQAAVRSKIGSLDRFVYALDRADVVFREEKNPRISDPEQIEVTLQGHGHHIRAKVSGPDQLTAVERAVSKLEKQLRKVKTKVVKRHRPNPHRESTHHPLATSAITDASLDVDEALYDEASTGGVLVEELEALTADELDTMEIPQADLVVPRIVKRKSFELIEMRPDVAVVRMQLLEHEFYLFRNAETGHPAVVYTRDDGEYGLIDERR